jgi:hypothetical protein
MRAVTQKHPQLKTTFNEIAMKKLLIPLCFLFGMLQACATSPLYEEDPSSGYGTVPRDNMGEPIWDKVKPRGANET